MFYYEYNNNFLNISLNVCRSQAVAAALSLPLSLSLSLPPSLTSRCRLSPPLADPAAAHGQGGDRPRHPQRLQGARLLAPRRPDQRHLSDPAAQPEGRLRRGRVRLAEEAHQGHPQPGHPGES